MTSRSKSIFSRKHPRKGQQQRAVAFSAKQRTCRASGRELPYFCTQLNASGGLLEVGTATPSATGGQYTDLNPNFFGTRCSQMSRLYNQWRLRRLIVRYRPYVPLGVSNNSFTSAYNLSFSGVAGFVLDPCTPGLSPTEVVEAGGHYFNFGKPSSWSLGSSPWLYVQPTVGDTLADIRFYSFGHFNAIQLQTSPSTAIQWGTFEFDWDIEFRFPIDADAEASLRVPVNVQGLTNALQNNSNRAATKGLDLSSISSILNQKDKNETKTEKDELVIVHPPNLSSSPSLIADL